MTKLKFKKVFSTAFVASLVALAASVNVNAATINETAGKEIEEGSYVLGISRFTPGTVLTAVRVSKATTNDNNFNKDVVGYEGASIYYYDLGEWYVLNDDNKAVPVTDAKVIKTLTSRDIYYVDNVEKVVSIAYKREIPNGKHLEFTTDKANKTVKYDADKGIMEVPVTAKSVTVTMVDDKNENVKTVLDTYNKEYTDDEKVNFEYEPTKASVGAITADDKITSSKDVTISGNTINVGGTVKWVSDAPAGHKVGILLSLPNGVNVGTASNTVVEVTRGNGKTEKLNWVNDSSTLKYAPVVKENETITIKVTWENKTTQTFTVKVTGELEAMPAGKLIPSTVYVKDKDGKDTEEVRLSGTVSSDQSTVTFSGKDVDWNGNVVVYVEPNEYFTSQTNFKYSSVVAKYVNVMKNGAYDADDKLSTEEEFINTTPVTVAKDVTELDGKRVIKLTIPMKENNDVTGRTATVSVDWQNGYVQTFDVVLADNTPFVYPTVTLDTATMGDSDVTFKPEEGEDPVNFDVKGYVAWSTTKGGNVVTTTVKLPTNGTTFSADEYKYMSVKVDGKTVTYTEKVNNKDVEKVLTFDKTVNGMNNDGTFTWDLIVKQGEKHTITIMYGDAEVKTFTLNVLADTEDSKTGSVELASADDENFDLNRMDATSYEVVGTYNSSTKKYAAIPFVYELGSNGLNVVVTNDAYASQDVKVTVKAGSETAITTTATADGTGARTIAVPLVSGKATTVTVEWDAVNKQTFVVTPKAGKVDFAEAAKGEIKLANNGSALEGATQSADKTKVTYSSQTIAWNTDGYKLANVILTAPEEKEITANKAYISINGGDYQDIAEKEPGYYKFTLDGKTVDGEAADGKFTFANGSNGSTKATITLPINVTATNQTFKITVAWTENYVVTYTLDVVDATLSNDYANSVLSIGESVANENNELEYNGNIPFDTTNGHYYVVNTKLESASGTVATNDTATSVKVIDAYSKKTYSQKNGVVTSSYVPDKVSLGEEGALAIYFSDEVKTATVEVTWDNDYKETFTIDASNATLNKINLTNKVVEDEEGNYSMTVNVGDEVNMVSTSSTATDITIDRTAEIKAYGTNGVVEEKEENGKITKIVAKAAGSVKYTISATGAESKDVTVYVLGEEDGKINITNPDITFVENEAKISVTPTGAREDYDVTVKVELFNESDKGYDTVKNVTLTKEFNSDVYSAETELDASKNYRYTITAKAGATGALVGEYGEAVLTLDADPKTYTVTFDANKGTAVDNLVVQPDATVPAPEVTRESKDGYFYVLKGWYEVNSTNFDEDGNYKVAAGKKLDRNGDIIAEAADVTFNPSTGKFNLDSDTYNFSTPIKKNVTLKAVWYRLPIVND